MANKIVALVGPHASGKTMIIKQLSSMGINFIPVYTTQNLDTIGTDKDLYHFMDKTEFFKQDFIAKFTYKGEYFGILKQDVLNSLHTYPISLTTLSIAGVKQLSKFLKGNFETVYIMCDYVTLVERMLRLGHTNADIKYHLEYAENNNEFDSWKLTTYVIKNVSDPQVAFNQFLTILGLTQMIPQDEFNRRIGKA